MWTRPGLIPRWLVVGALLAAGLGALAWGLTGDVVRVLEHSVLSLGPWGPPLFVIGFAALATAGVPRGALTVLGAMTYGSALGAGLAWLATMLAAVAGYGLGRTLRIDVHLRSARAIRVAQALSEGGFSSVVLARMSPVPFWVVSCGAGAVGLRWAPYAAGTAVGVLPTLVAYSLAAPVLGTLLRLTPVVAAVALGGLVLLRRKQQRLRAASPYAHPRPSSSSWHACSQRRQESAQALQCACMEA